MKVCRRGHEYTPGNGCPECNRICQAAWRAARSPEQIQLDDLSARRSANRSPEQIEYNNAKRRTANLTPARRKHKNALARACYHQRKEANENSPTS